MKQGLMHGGLTALLALGLAMPALGTLGLMPHAWAAIVVILLLSAAMGLAGVKRWSSAALAGAGLLCAGGWLLMGGADTLMEVVRGILLHASGLHAALPMIGGRAAMVLTVLITVLCFGMTCRSVGALPSGLVTVLAMTMLWLSDRGGLLLWLTPAAAAALTMVATSRHDEVRVGRVLPAMLAASALAFVLTPSGGVTIAPMKDAADQLRQRILDYFFFTEPRDVFSLASEGYYPEGINQLGGAAVPNNAPVMTVYTPRTVYLRGAIKNEYTGRVWQDTTGGRRYLWLSPRWRETRDTIFNVGLPSETLSASSLLQPVQITVRMERESESSLFVPQRIQSLTVSGDMVPYFNRGSEVFITRDLAAGDTYTVTAPVLTAGEQGIEPILAACENNADPAAYEAVRREYTVLPEHLQSQVYEIAQVAVQGASTPYEKAFAIQNYLRRNYHYTLDVAPQPENVDFVSNFLLVTREGYCTYFASAMTVLCRMVGLPARYVEGYVATPNSEGVAHVTGLQAHAWTEVYLAGFGWMTFDATPPSGAHSEPPDEGGQNNDPDETPSPEPTSSPAQQPTPTPEPSSAPEDGTPPTPTPTPTPPPSGETPSPEPDELPSPPPQQSDQPPEQPPGNPSPLWWIMLIVLVVLAACALRVWWMTPAQEAKRAKDDLARWMVWLQAICELLAAQHCLREPYETLSGYFHRADMLGFGRIGLGQIGDGASEIFYGGCMPTTEDIRAAAQACAALNAGMKPIHRLRILLHRAVAPKKKRDLLK